MGSDLCPICGEENHCMMQGDAEGECWCTKETFPEQIFQLVPPADRHKRCICERCVKKYALEMK